jgi:hypothetical protein
MLVHTHAHTHTLTQGRRGRTQKCPTDDQVEDVSF